MKKKSMQRRGISSIGWRLKYAMKSRGVAAAELSRRADVKISFLYDVISGKSANPSTVKLARVAEALGISLATLVNQSPRISPIVPYAMAEDDYIAIPCLSVQGDNSCLVRDPEHQSCSFLHSWISSHLKAQPTDLRMFIVRGDHMDPTLCNNDMLLVDITRRNPAQSGIFVLFDGYALIVRRLERVANSPEPRVRILSDNPQYSIYESSPLDAGIVGRVVWFSRVI